MTHVRSSIEIDTEKQLADYKKLFLEGKTRNEIMKAMGISYCRLVTLAGKLGAIDGRNYIPAAPAPKETRVKHVSKNGIPVPMTVVRELKLEHVFKEGYALNYTAQGNGILITIDEAHADTIAKKREQGSVADEAAETGDTGIAETEGVDTDGGVAQTSPDDILAAYETYQASHRDDQGPQLSLAEFKKQFTVNGRAA